jgi:hypothetical protein
MYRLLDLAGPEQAGEVRQVLAEPPEIRSRRLASNRGVTFADAFAVATPLLAADGSLIAAISATSDDPAEADSLDDLGEELKKAIATLGPNTASAALNQLSSGRSIRLGTLPAWRQRASTPTWRSRAADGSEAPFGWPALILGMWEPGERVRARDGASRCRWP